MAFVFFNILNIFHKKDEMHHAQAQGAYKTMNYKDLLPYKKMLYEGKMLPVPRDTNSFLSLYFSPNYMELPKEIEIHNKYLIDNFS